MISTQTIINKQARPRIAIAEGVVRHCSICGGISKLIVNGNRVCGECLHAGRVLKLLMSQEQHA